MRIHWVFYSNAKTRKNAEVLFNKVSRHFPTTPQLVDISGDRYSGHRVVFIDRLPDAKRELAIYQLFSVAESLANSWILGAVTASAHAWSNRSRIAGIRQFEWRELAEDEVIMAEVLSVKNPE